MTGTQEQTRVTSTPWGVTAAGLPVILYTLQSPDLTVRLSTYGARVVGVSAPDRTGQRAEVVLGYKTVADYEADTKTYFGATIGRYGNRIAKARFTLDGETYFIPSQNEAYALHGGVDGFDRKVWESRLIQDGVEMKLVSPAGDMGFPGTLTVRVRYTLERDTLRIDYAATTDAPTVLNLTNHSYFNLSGGASDTILNHVLMLNADHYTPIDASMLPTGGVETVVDTPLDFRAAALIGKRISEAQEQLERAGGYDHNFVLNGLSREQPRPVAHAVDPESGRTLTVLTTEPGVQFYSGNFLNIANIGISSEHHAKHAGFCLETQSYPDSPNRPSFPSTALRPGEAFHSTTMFVFGADQ